MGKKIKFSELLSKFKFFLNQIKEKPKYQISILALFVLFLFWFASEWVFPILLVTSILLIIRKSNQYLKKDEPNIETDSELLVKIQTLKIERKKFLVKVILIPLIIGFFTYLITDRIYGEKEVIIIGISNSSYGDNIDFADVYKKKCISKANDMISTYHSGLTFDMVTVSGGYDKLWNALENKRIDMAFVSPYNFARKINMEHRDTFDITYSKIGGKYTEIGTTYRSGFIFQKKYFKDLNRIDLLKGFIKVHNKSMRILLSKEQFSTSGRIVPTYYLKKFCNIDSISTSDSKQYPLIDTTFSLPERVNNIIENPESIILSSFSNDMWHNMKKNSPEVAKSLMFIPIPFDIPMDAVVVKQDHWDNMNSLFKRFVDFIKFRNVNLGKDRHDIIFESLRYIMQKSDNISDYDTLNFVAKLGVCQVNK